MILIPSHESLRYEQWQILKRQPQARNRRRFEAECEHRNRLRSSGADFQVENPTSSYCSSSRNPPNPSPECTDQIKEIHARERRNYQHWPNNCGAILFIVAKRRVMQFPLRSRLLTLSYTGLESGLGQREQSVPNADATASGKFVAVEKLRCRCHVQRSGFFCLHQHPFGRRGALWRCNQSLWSSR